jgi:mono/diheme cytochrome c family protein
MRGVVYAQENCGSCHAVRQGEASANPLAPTFTEIANTPGMTRIALSAWMRSEHVMMPHYIVDQDRIDDVWAYIATLEN